MNELNNNFVRVVFTGDCINFYDKTDLYNDTKGFTRNVRGIAKTWETLKAGFSDIAKFYDIVKFLDEHKLKTHVYCGMD